MLERLMASVCRASSKVATISSSVQRVTVRSWSGGSVLATEMTCTRVEEAILRGRPGGWHLAGLRSPGRGSAVATCPRLVVTTQITADLQIGRGGNIRRS